nr:putative bifunctional methylthioribulose-1-phosphate dehydratase/enolase-phosphatase E1 [Tanacetum cinerariifolium]
MYKIICAIPKTKPITFGVAGDEVVNEKKEDVAKGHIWRTGFEKTEIKGVVYDDVPEALERWHASGIKSEPELVAMSYPLSEAAAAKAAGLEVIISVRPGNGPLPENHGFITINSFAEVPF